MAAQPLPTRFIDSALPSRAEFEAFYLALPLERDRTRIAGLLYDSALLHNSMQFVPINDCPIVAPPQAAASPDSE